MVRKKPFNPSAMKIPIVIGKTISKYEIVICPECEGEGKVMIYSFGVDMNTTKICSACEGKRILRKIESVTYERIEEPKADNRPPITNNRK
jgi:hypothetical protein